MSNKLSGHHVAVIGAGFGDEGKGQMVDYFASSGNYSTVVRFNGGSQAGHTVVDPSGKTHIFSQLGSGSFHGLKTHLSRFMLINPVFLMREIEVFSCLGLPHSKITIDPEAFIVLPWDVELNRVSEKRRGESRHGSTGHGIFNATIRSSYPHYRMTAASLLTLSEDAIVALLQESLRFYNLDYNWIDLDWFEDEVTEFLNSIDEMKKFVTLKTDVEVVYENRCIFEGAQGLLLDQNSGFFPHVTPSNTGINNILAIIHDHDDLDVVYVTRTFLTRHGNGPMYLDGYKPKDGALLGYNLKLEDSTNVVNEWQGEMRYGPISIDQMRRAINRDITNAKQTYRRRGLMRFNVAVTWANANVLTTDGKDPLGELRKEFPVKFFAHERTRNDIIEENN